MQEPKRQMTIPSVTTDTRPDPGAPTRVDRRVGRGRRRGKADIVTVPVYARSMSTPTIPLGAFSVSLTVKDLAASRTFYEKLGFTEFHGQAEHGWLIMRNGGATIGLFEGMFERNILTFNPGWDAEAQPVDEYVDVRELQRRLKAAGLTFQAEADESTTGPASFIVVDPDGNPIFFDQHV